MLVRGFTLYLQQQQKLCTYDVPKTHSQRKILPESIPDGQDLRVLSVSRRTRPTRLARPISEQFFCSQIFNYCLPTFYFWPIFALNTQTPLPKVIPDVPERS